MIHVIATIETAKGRRDDFLAAFNELVPDVLAEDGCIEYGPTIDVATALSNDPVRENAVTVVEKWEGVDALHAHLKAPHMVRYRDRVKDIVISISIRVLEPA
jgi:quinol monooxygenase YgiN